MKVKIIDAPINCFTIGKGSFIKEDEFLVTDELGNEVKFTKDYFNKVFLIEENITLDKYEK